MRISYSSLNTFKTCPLKYKFQEIDKIKTPKSKEAIFGTLMHNILQRLHSSSPPPPLEAIEKFYRDNWNKDIYQNNEDEELIHFNQGLRILRSYYSSTNFSAINPICLETYFEANITENCTLSGKIDRIDKFDGEIFEIIDYKTSKQLPSQEKVDEDLQLSIYALGLMKRWPQIDSSKIKLSLYYLKHNMKLSSSRTPEQLEATKTEILSIIDNIQKQEFKPIPNPLCDWCGHQKLCPMFKHKFKEEKLIIPNNEDVEQIISELFIIEEKQKENKTRIAELKEKINLFCDANDLDRIFSETGFVTRVTQQRYEFDAEALKNLLQPIGKWSTILSPDTGKIKELIKTAPMKLRTDIENTKKLSKEFKKLNLTKKK